MNFYWFDHKSSASGNPESQGYQRLVGLFEGKQVRTIDDLKEKAGPFLCMVHASEGIDEWAEIANVEKQNYVLILSIGAIPNPVLRKIPGVYTSPVDNWFNRGLDRLISNTTLKSQFIKSLVDGSPKWNLLIPTASAENLIALYLLSLAKKLNVDVTPSEQLLDDAFNEVSKIIEEIDYDWEPDDKKRLLTTDGQDHILELISKWQVGR